MHIPQMTFLCFCLSDIKSDQVIKSISDFCRKNIQCIVEVFNAVLLSDMGGDSRDVGLDKVSLMSTLKYCDIMQQSFLNTQSR